LLSVGDKVSRGTYRVHSRFRRVVNFRRGEWLVSVVDPVIGPGPLNIVAEGIDFAGALELRVEPTGIVLNRARMGFDDGNVYRSRIDVAGVDRGRLHRNLPALRDALLEMSSPRSLAFLLDPARIEGLRPGFERALAAHLAEGVGRILGGEMPAGRTKGTQYSFSKERVLCPLCSASPERQDPRGQRRGWNPDATETIRCRGSGNATDASGRAGGAEGGPPAAQTVREDGGSPERQDPRGEYGRTQKPDHRRGWNPDHRRALRPDATETFRCHGSGNATDASGVKMIAGCGFGLTPSGDDFICGMLVGLHVADQVRGNDFSTTREAVYRAAETKNFLSRTFLSLAYEGSVDARLKALLRALAWGDPAMTRQCAESAISVGETSGADTLTGLYMTLEKYV